MAPEQGAAAAAPAAAAAAATTSTTSVSGIEILLQSEDASSMALGSQLKSQRKPGPETALSPSRIMDAPPSGSASDFIIEGEGMNSHSSHSSHVYDACSSYEEITVTSEDEKGIVTDGSRTPSSPPHQEITITSSGDVQGILTEGIPPPPPLSPQHHRLLKRDSSLEDLMDSSLEDMEDYQGKDDDEGAGMTTVECTTAISTHTPQSLAMSLPLPTRLPTPTAKPESSFPFLTAIFQQRHEWTRTLPWKQVEEDELMSDEEIIFVDDVTEEGADDIDSTSSTGSSNGAWNGGDDDYYDDDVDGNGWDPLHRKRLPHIQLQQQQKKQLLLQSRYSDDLNDDITDEEDEGEDDDYEEYDEEYDEAYDEAYDEEQVDTFYYEEIELPDKITPIQKVWRDSFFFGPYWTRLEHISEGEEEDERDDSKDDQQDDGYASEGSVSLKGEKSPHSISNNNDLDKSWGSLDSHKRSWHSSHSRRHIVSPTRSPEDGDPASPRRSPPVLSKKERAARKAERRKAKLIDEGVIGSMESGGQDPDVTDNADASLLFSSTKSKKKSTKTKKSKSATEKKVLREEYREEHDVNDSLRGNRTALLKAKKKAAAAKAAAKKKLREANSRNKSKGKKKATPNTCTSAPAASALAEGRSKEEEDGAIAITLTESSLNPQTETTTVVVSAASAADSSSPKMPKPTKSKSKRKSNVESVKDGETMSSKTTKLNRKLKSASLDSEEKNAAVFAGTDSTELDAACGGNQADVGKSDGTDLVRTEERSDRSKSDRHLKVENTGELPESTDYSNNNSARSKSKSKRKSKTGSTTSKGVEAEENDDAQKITRSPSKSSRKRVSYELDKSSTHSKSKSRGKSKTSAMLTDDGRTSTEAASVVLLRKTSRNDDSKSDVTKEEMRSKNNEKQGLRRGKRPGNENDESVDSVGASQNESESKSPKSTKRLLHKDVKDLSGSQAFLDQTCEENFSKHSLRSNDSTQSSKKKASKSPKRQSKTTKRQSSSKRSINDLDGALALLDDDYTEDRRSVQSLRSDDASKSSRRQSSKGSPKSPKLLRSKYSSESPKPRKSSSSMTDLSVISDDASKSSRRQSSKGSPKSPKLLRSKHSSESPKPRKSSSSMTDLSVITPPLLDDDTVGSSAEQSRSKSARKRVTLLEAADAESHQHTSKSKVKTPKSVTRKSITKVKTSKSETKTFIADENDGDGGDDETTSLEPPDSISALTSISTDKKGAATSGTAIDSTAIAMSKETDEAANPESASKKPISLRDQGAQFALPGSKNPTRSVSIASSKPRKTMSFFSRQLKNVSVTVKEQDNTRSSPDERPLARDSGILRALLSPIRRSTSLSIRNKKKAMDPPLVKRGSSDSLPV